MNSIKWTYGGILTIAPTFYSTIDANYQVEIPLVAGFKARQSWLAGDKGLAGQYCRFRDRPWIIVYHKSCHNTKFEYPTCVAIL